MNDTTQDVPERFAVFLNERDRPELYRFRLDKTSPKGRKRYWLALNIQKPFLLPCPPNREPSKTVDEAVDVFQIGQMMRFGFLKDCSIREGVRSIIAAEALRPVAAGLHGSSERFGDGMDDPNRAER